MKKLLVIICACFLMVGCSSTNSKTTSETTSTSNQVEKGDVVKIDFVGKLNGTAFSGGTGNGYLLEIGSGTFIDGFEDQLIGMKAQEKKTITVTFPTNYSSEDLAGKECTFDVTINHLYREVN